MKKESSNTIEYPHRRLGPLAWLCLPLAFFPFAALVTYDWHAIVALNIPPAPHANWIGPLGDWFAYYGYMLFGFAIWLVPVLCIFSSLVLIRRGWPDHILRRLVFFGLLLCTCACLVQVLCSHGGACASLARTLNIGQPGGAVGYLVMTRFLSPLLSDFGSSILISVLLLASLVTAIGLQAIGAFFTALFTWAQKGRESAATGLPDASAPTPDPNDPVEILRQAKEAAKRQREEEKAAAKAAKLAAKEAKRAEKEAARAPVPAPTPTVPTPAVPVSAPASATPASADASVDKGPYLLPPISLLNPLKTADADHGDVGEMSRKLTDTLKLFGVDASLAYTVPGPVVTKYALNLAPGTRYTAATSLSDNLMGALHAKSIRIEAPIPGEECIGIEVPNRAPVGITFREIVESDAWQKFKGELPLLFGKRADGTDLVADLASMPHMLVAGATGQGKSVCLNAIINGLLMTKTPQELKLIMVDPKSVEFTAYAALPHLIVPVITENKKVVFSLHWAVAEMEKRLKLFARARVRNIYDFNHRANYVQPDMFDSANETATDDMPKTVPYIVIIIDEAADLIGQCGKEVNPDIQRITQKARAAGIHLILATQRPDAKIITGTIKANIPGRVAFKTATSIDSRTILDDTGAENLIGRGDMLFKAKDGVLVRAQGAWISDPEIERITKFIEEHATTDFDDRFTRKLSTIKEEEVDLFADDEATTAAAKEEAAAAREQVKADENASDFKKAVECVINTQRASTSHFQRKLGWGYNHSAKIMDMLEDAGIIGPQIGAGPRQIIMEQDQLIAILNGNNGACEDASVADAGVPVSADTPVPEDADASSDDFSFDDPIPTQEDEQ